MSSPARQRQLAAHQLLRDASLELARLRRIHGAYRQTARRIAGARARLAFAAALLAAPLAEPALAGTPTFLSPFLIPSVVGASPAFADIDGDGDLDAFVGERFGDTTFFANTGTTGAPAFAAPVTNPFGLGDVGYQASPAFADIDGDGDLDAFVGEDYGHTAFFANTGTASAPAFALPSVNAFGLADVGNGASPTFADLDDDGDLDAFVGEPSGITIFFANTGTASAPAFAASSINPFGLADVGLSASPAFADLDDDGDLDAFVGKNSGNTIFFANTGTASAPAFAAPSTNPFGLADVGTYASPAFADLDGDGDLDAFVGDSSAGNTIFFANTGTASAPAFAAPSGIPFGPAGGYGSPALADLDGDADLDAFVGRATGNTIFFANTGTASAPAFAASSGNPFGLADVGGRASPTFADLDGDGDLDAFVGNNSGNTIFFANTGTASAPAFAASSANPFGIADVGSVASPAFADLDGDGDLDAFVGEYFGNTIFFANTGTASAPAFAAPSANPFGLADVGFGASSPAFADLDGDGDLDAFTGEHYGKTIFFANTGTASVPAFAASSTNPFGLADVGSFASPAFADLDGDGDLDAFVGDYSGLTFFFENVELGPGTCTDGLDNDFDGRIDSPSDPGCADAADPNERSTRQCDNGIDDDADGKIDWRGDTTGDPHCVSLTDNNESTPLPPPPGCGIGPELLLLGPLLAATRRRPSRRLRPALDGSPDTRE